MTKNCANPSKIAAILSVVAVIMAAVVSVGEIDLWLAGTQWILVGIVLGIYAIYLSGCSCGCDVDKDKQ